MNQAVKRLLKRETTWRGHMAHVVAATALLYGAEARADELAGLSNFVCMIANFVKGGYLLAGGVIVIIIGAIAIAQSESTIVKFVSTIGIGIGIAAACIPLLQKLGISATYCTFV
ncbi:hypothetical protein LBW62_08090 [Ralstonia solanacearum]|uniref:hypothetical protein n=1 Tax=Ralstonia solanacearum TaxID=305 RepID=UPI0005C51F2F|nr:hypothetical protein [Ralstonia solanacearum]MBB6592737.1 hypothetical protein [Ralstonia solanacearum]MBB6596959.1 hypothetical protein [Ralstonia solanacearum]MDB0541203.1 hypothetical protein [Ralstonia solanacearum]MDB0551423.1 hypothetical protein [Ralstonia solanacearum]MDB0556152.1 hypothetical protein [Ralstonia solanacearum]